MSGYCRVVAPDLRGHGESQWVEEYDLDSQVSDVRSLVAALGLDNITLVGQSLGGVISIRYAGGVPAELARLVLVDIAPTIPKSTRKQMYTDFEKVTRFDSPEHAIATEIAANPLASHDHLAHRIRNAIQRLPDGSWTWRYDPALEKPGAIAFRGAEDDGWAAAGRIQVPSLVMRGAESEYLTSENADRLVETIPTCEFVEFAECGHVVPIDEPDGFRDAMIQFMSFG
jgi:pimeloyl-ACP methyl ester carboxylesterase